MPFLREDNLAKLNLLFLLGLVVFMIATTGGTVIWMQIQDFDIEVERMKKENLIQEKERLRYQVNSIIQRIEYEKSLAESKLKNELREKVNEAWQLANNIYANMKDNKPVEEIEKTIHDALFAIRWNEGRGYYFVLDTDYVMQIHSNNPELEGRNVYDVKDGKGKYLNREFMQIAQTSGAGFSEYYWKKPGDPLKQNNLYQKFTYIRLFEPLNWIIATGEYMNDFELEVQRDIIESLRVQRWGRSGYPFILDDQYRIIMHPIHPEIEGQRISSLPDGDVSLAYRKLIASGKTPNGDFVRYSWDKPDGTLNVPKMTFSKQSSAWGWVICWGAYIDDIDNMVQLKEDALQARISRRVYAFLFPFVIFSLIAVAFSIVFSKTIKNMFSRYRETVQNRSAELTEMNENLSREINDKISAQSALKESETRYRRLADYSTDMISLHDMDGFFQYVSPACKSLLNFETDHLLGRNAYEFIHPDDIMLVRDVHSSMINSNDFFSVEYRFRRHGGGYVWLESKARLVKGEDEAGTEQLIIVSRDISKRKKAENEIHKFNAISDNAPHGTAITDIEGEIIYANFALAKMLKLGSDQMPGRSISSILLNDNSEAARTLVTDRKFSSEELLLREDDSPLPVLVSSSLLYDEHNQPSHAAFSIIDISEIKQYQKDLQMAKENAERANQSKNSFLANMSHEMRTPLNGVLGMAQLLADTPLDDEQKKFLGYIRISGQSLLSLIEDILDIARIEANAMKVIEHPVNLRNLVQDVESFFKSNAESKGLSLQCTVSDSVPDELRGDGFRIKQILNNLIGNAIKFTHSGQVALNATAFQSSEGCMVKFDVTDTGIGIPQERLDDIFETFTQVDPSLTRQYEGTGLGLSIVRSITNLLGGYIEVQSEEGKGSKFTISLPMLSSDEQDVLNAAKEEQASSEHFNLRVLVVEDNLINLKVARKMLENLGCEVHQATNGKEALDKIQSGETYACIFMDCRMPVMDGYQATKSIREFEGDNSHTPIIAMTANAMQSDIERSLASGMDEHLSKPVSKKMVVKVLRQYGGAPVAS